MFYTHEKTIRQENLPYYFRKSPFNTYIELGDYIPGGNEPYCFPQEKQCANTICRVLTPEKTVLTAFVIRQDGTVWKIYLKQFKEVTLLNIER